ncbi:MAG: carboxylesterase/lipase family protein [Alphaproteobacteria bacterium]|nr:carboxylesterase/lipase family protein [Alphaproteobacteria bacterium]MBU1514802.1 carboxylesterase/lipase family protein [Alphaproteobacteria bacterium]MBU2093933.1 carboxylesterase/lipase family protein [Alphaproteobacteria bacterium]MBU2153360.1 carboxylesterase/lipase family protein [Alphaproteobacteria bacterium]MBU2309788.1 carboxylesterase/lipase family protein [Alphaproteobacteria bacterium]
MGLELTRRGAVGAGLGLAAMAWSARAAQTVPAPVATTKHGPVRGDVDDGILAFRGVRYGADTGPRRFQPPAPPTPWTDVADATAYGAASPQRRGGDPTSEDCLFLNVWTPALDAGRRPVMVYIHGGAYSNGSGSAPLYDGVRLCKRGDVVVVTLNHRLNAFGYAYLARLVPALADSGNAGQLDLILALQWVRDNIAVFGGDPGKVMVFGQSGGGAKIATLMATSAAAGLFHRAATMSGQQVTASGPGNATRRALAFLDACKLKPDQAAALSTLAAERLVEALGAEDPVLGFGGLYFGPVLDERSLKRHPFYPDAPAQSAKIPIIIGNTHDETRAFLGNDPTNFTVGWDGLAAKLTQANLRVDIDPDTVIAAYRRLYPAYSPSDVLFAATTAARSWRGAIIELEMRAKAGHPTWAYQLDYPAAGPHLRAAHASDIQLVFDNLAKPGATAEGPAAQQLADQMADAFLAFARTGDPNHQALPKWAPYDLAHRRTMVFDTPSKQVADPRAAERRLFEKVPFIQAGT